MGSQERFFPGQIQVIELCRSGVPSRQVAERTFYSVERVRSLAREAGVAAPTGRPPKDRQRILSCWEEARRQGYPTAWVAQRVSCSQTTVYRVLREMREDP